MKDLPGFVFFSFPKALVDGELYTLDPCKNDWYGLNCMAAPAVGRLQRFSPFSSLTALLTAGTEPHEGRGYQVP